MTNYWSYIVMFLSGIIAGLVLYVKIKAPDQVINDNQRIGKIKSRGTGNTQSTSLVRGSLDPDSDPGEKKSLLDRIFPGREFRRLARKERREARLRDTDPP